MLRDLKTDDEGRIRSLHAYAILDTKEEQPFEHVVSLVQQILMVPMCAVSLVDRYRQWFKAKRGLDVCETARDISFCTHTIQQDRIFIVEDAAEHPLFKTNPLVTGEPGIRSYIGMPLQTPDGYNLGALCAIDTKPRSFSDHEMEILQKLANVVMDELELRQIAARDPLTHCLSRSGWRKEASQEREKAHRYHRPMSVAMLDIDRFKSINDTYGHPAGDRVIQALADTLTSDLRECDVIGRYGGEEFVVVMPETNSAEAAKVCERIRQTFEARAFDFGADVFFRATISIGFCEMIGDETLDDLIAMADQALYRAKRAGRNKVQCFNPVLEPT